MRKPSPLAFLFYFCVFPAALLDSNAEELDFGAENQTVREAQLELEGDYAELKHKYENARLELQAAQRKIDQLRKGLTDGHLPAKQAAIDEPNDAQTDPKPEHLKTIVDIRQRNGSVLKGSLLEDSAVNERDFVDAFKRLKFPPVISPVTNQPQTHPHLASPLQPASLPSWRKPHYGGQHLVESLMEATRQLELEAHELDRDHLFKQADDLRRLANRLRKMARTRFAEAAGPSRKRRF